LFGFTPIDFAMDGFFGDIVEFFLIRLIELNQNHKGVCFKFVNGTFFIGHLKMVI